MSTVRGSNSVPLGLCAGCYPMRYLNASFKNNQRMRPMCRRCVVAKMVLRRPTIYGLESDTIPSNCRKFELYLEMSKQIVALFIVGLLNIMQGIYQLHLEIYHIDYLYKIALSLFKGV